MKNLFFFVTAIFTSLFSFAQDVIVLRTGDEKIVKILSVTESVVNYEVSDSLSKEMGFYPLEKVFMVKYADGNKTVFKSEDEKQKEDVYTIDAPSPKVLETDWSYEGKQDAIIYYKKYKKATIPVLVISLISPIVGMVPAIITSVKAPEEKNLGRPSVEKWQHAEYRDAYKKKAHNIKAGKVWANVGYAFAFNFTFVLLMSATY